ncbi:MAG: hypothetical protein PHH77_05430 [Victivallaceae bacterium]|nr:hypothetical protein [Victivallaceae bacterium]
MIRLFYLKCLLLSCAGLCACTVFAHEFKIIVSGDAKSPSAEDCREMGVSALWFYSGLPLKFNEKGEPANPQKFASLFERFNNTDIALIPLLNIFYQKNPGKCQLSRFSDKPRYRCFSKDNSDIVERLRLLVKWLGHFKNFGGLCLDDEPGIQPGGCICENCVKLFRGKYGLNPPPDKVYFNTPKGVVPENNPVLLWTKFQQDECVKYYASLAAAIKKENPKIQVLNIPAAAYFSGKQLSILDCKAQDFIKSGRRVSLDDCHIRDFQLYVQFYMNEISSSGWKNKIADGLCLYMMNKGLVNFPNLPVYYKFEPVSKRAVISVPAFKRFILQTFSEGAKGIVYFPGRSLTPGHVEAAADVYNKFIVPVCADTPKLYKPDGKVAVLYSTTTRIFADLWKNNPLERYKNLHECDAMAYYLLKEGIPFKVLLENELSPQELKKIPVIFSAGFDYVSADKAKLLEEYVKNGGKLITDRKSQVNIGLKADFDAGYWYRAVTDGNQRASDMEFQAGLLDTVLGKYLENISVPCSTSCRHINLNYLTDGKDLYIFAVNNDLDAPVSAMLCFDRKYDVADILAKKEFKNIDRMRVSIEPGELKVIKLNHNNL